MIKQTDSSVLIHTNVKGYQVQVSKHKEYLSALESQYKALEKFKNVTRNDFKQIIENPIQYSENSVLKAFEDVNLMKLSYKKLVDVLELDVSELELSAKRLNGLNPIHYKEPNLDDFKMYASTKEQLSRLNALNKILEGLEELNPTEGYNAKNLKQRVHFAFKGRFIKHPNNIEKSIPNYNYVLNGNVY
jgi:hypothetical protein